MTTEHTQNHTRTLKMLNVFIHCSAVSRSYFVRNGSRATTKTVAEDPGCDRWDAKLTRRADSSFSQHALTRSFLTLDGYNFFHHLRSCFFSLTVNLRSGFLPRRTSLWSSGYLFNYIWRLQLSFARNQMFTTT